MLNTGNAGGIANRIKLGGWLLDCICESSHWFTRETRRDGRKLFNYVVPTPEFISIKDEVMSNAGLFSPLAWPMLVEQTTGLTKEQVVTCLTRLCAVTIWFAGAIPYLYREKHQSTF